MKSTSQQTTNNSPKKPNKAPSTPFNRYPSVITRNTMKQRNTSDPQQSKKQGDI